MPYMKLRRAGGEESFAVCPKKNQETSEKKCKKLSQRKDNQTNTQKLRTEIFSRLASVFSSSCRRFCLGLSRPVHIFHPENRSKSGWKATAKFIKKTNQRHLKDNQFKVNRSLPSSFFFPSLPPRQRTTFAAASLSWMLLCLRCLMPPEKKKDKPRE